MGWLGCHHSHTPCTGSYRTTGLLRRPTRRQRPGASTDPLACLPAWPLPRLAVRLHASRASRCAHHHTLLKGPPPCCRGWRPTAALAAAGGSGGPAGSGRQRARPGIHLRQCTCCLHCLRVTSRVRGRRGGRSRATTSGRHSQPVRQGACKRHCLFMPCPGDARLRPRSAGQGGTTREGACCAWPGGQRPKGRPPAPAAPLQPRVLTAPSPG